MACQAWLADVPTIWIRGTARSRRSWRLWIGRSRWLRRRWRSRPSCSNKWQRPPMPRMKEHRRCSIRSSSWRHFDASSLTPSSRSAGTAASRSGSAVMLSSDLESLTTRFARPEVRRCRRRLAANWRMNTAMRRPAHDACGRPLLKSRSGTQSAPGRWKTRICRGFFSARPTSKGNKGRGAESLRFSCGIEGCWA